VRGKLSKIRNGNEKIEESIVSQDLGSNAAHVVRGGEGKLSGGGFLTGRKGTQGRKTHPRKKGMVPLFETNSRFSLAGWEGTLNLPGE